MIKTLKENIVLQNKFFTVYNNEVLFNESKEGVHLKVESGKNQADGIAVLPILENGNILLVKNFRYAADRFTYQAVKGGNGTKFTTDELAIQCVVEELEEEMNKQSNDIIFLKKYYESPSIMAAQGHAFLAFNCKEVVDKKYYMEESECIDDIIEIPFEEIDDFMKDKETCATTLYLISEYQKYVYKNK